MFFSNVKLHTYCKNLFNLKIVRIKLRCEVHTSNKESFYKTRGFKLQELTEPDNSITTNILQSYVLNRHIQHKSKENYTTGPLKSNSFSFYLNKRHISALFCCDN